LSQKSAKNIITNLLQIY